MPKLALALLLSSLVVSGCDDDTEQVEADDEAQAVEATDDHEDRQPEEDPEPQALSFAQNDWECTEDRADQIRQWMEARGEDNAQRVAIDKPEQLELVEREGDLESGDFRPTLALEFDRLNIDGRRSTSAFYADLDSLRRPITNSVERVQELARAEAEASGEDFDPPLPLVLIDQSVTKSGIDAALGAIVDAGVEEAILVFKDPGFEESADPLPADLRRELSDMEAYNQDLNEEIRQRAGDCAPIATAFDELQSLSPEERMPRLRQTLPEAWLECQCQADIEFIVAAVMWPSAQGFAATTERVTVTDILAEVAEHERITWGDLW